MLTEIELQTKIDTVISKLQKCNESVVTNVLKQYDCDSIDDLKVMIENAQLAAAAAIGIPLAIGAGYVGSKITKKNKIAGALVAVLGGGLIGVLSMLYFLKRAEKKLKRQLAEARKSGREESVKNITKKLEELKPKISKAGTVLKQRISKLSPEKKANFLKKAEKLKVKFKD